MRAASRRPHVRPPTQVSRYDVASARLPRSSTRIRLTPQTTEANTLHAAASDDLTIDCSMVEKLKAVRGLYSCIYSDLLRSVEWRAIVMPLAMICTRYECGLGTTAAAGHARWWGAGSASPALETVGVDLDLGVAWDAGSGRRPVMVLSRQPPGSAAGRGWTCRGIASRHLLLAALLLLNIAQECQTRKAGVPRSRRWGGGMRLLAHRIGAIDDRNLVRRFDGGLPDAT
ncbi:hypothetical protein WOLCODRAFT_152872 [Wolfiporia cocos MD-104 SS10]|uniref:Uncharacterized protein n=1 Tax=Wolfiporia cocos (strain MD-104) TaxID=742152 RepID=A0A2H3JKT3_WOLCO|nr:hypothetical protein WOLCODRAFT_152872 [Wolfiporia cocos MD-104 SS10]